MAGAPDQMSAAINEKPLGRLGRADEVAVAVLWMRSTGASLMIGHALVVDGGYTAKGQSPRRPVRERAAGRPRRAASSGSRMVIPQRYGWWSKPERAE
jgi:hypothetical protein